MDGNIIKELKPLIEKLMYASTKREAQPPLRRLEFIASGLKGSISPYLLGKLNEVIAFAKQASGRVNDKQHWISCTEQCWYIFENGVAGQMRTKENGGDHEEYT